MHFDKKSYMDLDYQNEDKSPFKSKNFDHKVEGPDIRKFEYPLVFLDLMFYLCRIQIYYDQGFTYDSDPSYESS